MNSNSFFLTQLHEMESCITRLENKNFQTVSSGIISLYCCLRNLYFWPPRESAKNNWWREFAVFIQCSRCKSLGCVLIIAKVYLSRVVTESEGNEQRRRYLACGTRLNNCWRKTVFILDIFSRNTKVVNCNQRQPFLQYNEFSNMFWKKSRVQLESKWCSD